MYLRMSESSGIDFIGFSLRFLPLDTDNFAVLVQ